MSADSVRSRIVFCRIRGQQYNLFVICTYIPHRDRTTPSQLDTYKDLAKLLDQMSERNCVILMGDFKSRLQRHGMDDEVTGRWCMHTSPDEGGQTLLRLATLYQLPAMSTCFQPRKGKIQSTYINKVPGRAPSQIDYILVSGQ